MRPRRARPRRSGSDVARTDDRAHEPGDRRRWHGAPARVAPPLGRRRGRAGRRSRPRRLRRRHRRVAAAPTPRSWPSPPPATRAPGRHACTRRSSPARTTAAPGRAPTPSSTPASARVVVGDRRSRPAGGRRRASTGCGPPGIEVEVGVGADEVRRPAGPLPAPPPHRPTAASCSSWPRPSTAAPPPPTAPASGSPGPRPAPTPTACGPTATPCWSAPAPSGPTTRPSPCACPTASCPTASSSPAGSCSAGPRPTPGCSPAVEMAGPLADVARRARAARACCRCWSRAGPPWPTTFHARRPGRPLRPLPGARPCSAATTPAACSPGPGAPTIGDVWRGRIDAVTAARRRPAHRPVPPHAEEPDHVHRHRRGAGHRAPRATAPGCASTPPPCSTTSPSATSIAVNGCCLTVVGWGETDGRSWWEADVVDETFARTSLGALAAGSTRSTSSARSACRTASAATSCRATSTPSARSSPPAPDLRIQAPGELLRYVVEKGSITVDGISLTVVEPLDDGFTVAVIPHTAGGHHARLEGPRRPRQPRGRRDRQVHRAPARRPDRRQLEAQAELTQNARTS